jgi:glycosyltransferase involved in cell wall biosynthesis
MRVLHCYRTYFPDPQGGTQEAIRQMALSTQAEGVRNTIFTLSPSPHPQVLQRPEGDVFRGLSWAAPASCDLGTVGGILHFRRLVKGADIVHYHFPWPFGDVLHEWGGSRGKPAVMTYHSDVVRQRVLGLIYRPLMVSMLGAMNAVVATSEAYAKSSTVLRKYIRPSRLKVIPLGICEQSYQQAIRESQDICVQERFGVQPDQYFLSLGVLRYYKGLHTLIDAASSVDFPIVLAGQGPMRAALEKKAQDLPHGRVRFVGPVSDAEKLALIANCRTFVLASHLRSEAFGMVLVESAMLGRPMISCAIGTGTTFVNEHEKTGLVVLPENPSMLADAMKRFVTDEAFALRCGSQARARYEHLFSGEALGRAYASLYRSVIEATC